MATTRTLALGARMAESKVTAAPRKEAARSDAGSGSRLVVAALVFTGLFAFYWAQGGAVAEAWRLNLPDSDDAMRLVGVRDLLAGQGWFDTHQYRYLPPDGTLMHWSRLVDLPIAASIAAVAGLLGQDVAERVVVTGWPLMLFAVYAGVVALGTGRLFGARAGGLAVVAAGQMVVFSDLFAPGRIDHHNVQVILMAGSVIAFGFAGASLVSGILVGASLAIGLETLPFAAIIGAAYALLWIVHGEAHARALRAFALGCFAATLIAFLVQTAPALWLVPACDALSAPWLALTGGAALAAAGLTAAGRWLPSAAARGTAGAVAAALVAAVVAASFPACLEGPYAMVPQPYRDLWIHGIVEAFSFRRFLAANPSAALQAVVPLLLAAAAMSVAAWREATWRRGILGLLAVLLWLGVVLTQVQIRTVYIASAFLPIAIAVFFDRLIVAAPARAPQRAVAWIAAVLMLGLPWMLGVTAVRGLMSGSKASSADPPTLCVDPDAVAALRTLPAGLMLTQIDMGPAVLLHTQHAIIAAGYHRAPAGIAAAVDAFSGSYADMRRTVDTFHPDYLVLCPDQLRIGQDAPPPFVSDLAAGASVDWLQPIDLGQSPLMAWRVRPPR